MPHCAYCGSYTPELSYRPCPSCGNPLNGAPRPRTGTSPAVIIAIVLVVALVGIAFIGILAAIAIPNFLTAKERAIQKRTQADMLSLSTALEAYAVDNDRYPEASSIAELQGVLSPTYIRDVPTTDGWNHPLRYEVATKLKPFDRYWIASPGKDGQFEHDSLQQYERGARRDYDRDIVLGNGDFIQYPGSEGER